MPTQKLTIALFFLGLFLPFLQASAGTVLSPYKYAWSDNAGYINFENVIIEDDILSGHAWSANKGFIKFDPGLGGVLNDGAGNLSGSAWGEQLGWIDFDGVSIDGNGKFSGTAEGDLVGTITFDCPIYCDVQTDWRQASPIPSPGTGGNGDSSNSSGRSGASREAPSQARTIGILDLNSMMADWGSQACGSQGDLDEDCRVGILDFNLSMVYWGSIYQL